MSVIASDLIFYKSLFSAGGIDSLGGGIDVASPLIDDFLHDLFDVVTDAEAVSGIVKQYRCIYVKNTNGATDLTDVIFYIQTLCDHDKNLITLAEGAALIDQDEASIASEITDPNPTVIFSGGQAGPSFGVDLTYTLGSGEWKSLWLKRTVTSDANAQAAITCVIAIQGDTT